MSVWPAHTTEPKYGIVLYLWYVRIYFGRWGFCVGKWPHYVRQEHMQPIQGQTEGMSEEEFERKMAREP